MAAEHIPTDITRAKVTALVMAGVKQELIADVVGIAATTLRGHYRDELDYGMAHANSIVAARLYDLCRNGNITALIFWAKPRMGWRETGDVQDPVGHEVDGMDPVETFRNRIEAMRGRRIVEAPATVVEVEATNGRTSGGTSE